jgi:hypothetical protein
MNSGRFVEPSKVTLAEFLERWLRDYVDTSVRPMTSEGYRAIMNNHLVPKLGHIRLDGLRPGAQGRPYERSHR